jgi:hypothetical protein
MSSTHGLVIGVASAHEVVMRVRLRVVGSAEGLLTEVLYVSGDGEAVTTTLGDVDEVRLLQGLPVRPARSHRGSTHYSGWFWSATQGAHLVFESRLEHDRLLMADFDPDVQVLATQPLWLQGSDRGVRRRHVPDVLVETRSGVVLADVKPAEFVKQPEVAAVLMWTARLCAMRGWRYEVWSEPDPAVLANLRLLSAARRTTPDAGSIATLATVHPDGCTIGEATRAVAALSITPARLTVLWLLWAGRWTADLTRPLSDATVLSVGA